MADITYQTVTNLPDIATQRFRNDVFPSLTQLAGRAPRVYGSIWNPETQQFERDPNAPLTAETNADLTSAAQAIRDMQGGQTGTFQKAVDAFGNAAGIDIYGAGMPSYGLAGQYYGQAAGVNTAGQYQPYGSAAMGLYGQSTYPTGLSAASPYLQSAGQSSVQNINQYMNPYNEQVTNRIAQLGARNLSENLLPQISSDFIRAGGYGSTRQRDLIGRALRDTQESILGKQGELLQQGYGQGLGASAADLARYGQLAGTAGSLGTQQQQLLQGAASGISGIGQNLANLYGSDAARMLAAGQGYAGIGAGLGSLAGQQAANQLAVGQGQINLANAAETSRLRQIAALQGVGESEEARRMREIEANRAQVAAENAAPFYNVGQATSIAAGAPSGATTGQTTTSAPSPSLASQVGGLAVGALGTAKALGAATGGAIKKGSLKKASYGKLPKRGLSMFARAA